MSQSKPGRKRKVKRLLRAGEPSTSKAIYSSIQSSSDEEIEELLSQKTFDDQVLKQKKRKKNPVRKAAKRHKYLSEDFKPVSINGGNSPTTKRTGRSSRLAEQSVVTSCLKQVKATPKIDREDTSSQSSNKENEVQIGRKQASKAVEKVKSPRKRTAKKRKTPAKEKNTKKGEKSRSTRKKKKIDEPDDQVIAVNGNNDIFNGHEINNGCITNGVQGENIEYSQENEYKKEINCQLVNGNINGVQENYEFDHQIVVDSNGTEVFSEQKYNGEKTISKDAGKIEELYSHLVTVSTEIEIPCTPISNEEETKIHEVVQEYEVTDSQFIVENNEIQVPINQDCNKNETNVDNIQEVGNLNGQYTNESILMQDALQVNCIENEKILNNNVMDTEKIDNQSICKNKASEISYRQECYVHIVRLDENNKILESCEESTVKKRSLENNTIENISTKQCYVSITRLDDFSSFNPTKKNKKTISSKELHNDDTKVVDEIQNVQSADKNHAIKNIDEEIIPKNKIKFNGFQEIENFNDKYPAENGTGADHQLQIKELQEADSFVDSNEREKESPVSFNQNQATKELKDQEVVDNNATEISLEQECHQTEINENDFEYFMKLSMINGKNETEMGNDHEINKMETIEDKSKEENERQIQINGTEETELNNLSVIEDKSKEENGTQIQINGTQATELNNLSVIEYKRKEENEVRIQINGTQETELNNPSVIENNVENSFSQIELIEVEKIEQLDDQINSDNNNAENSSEQNCNENIISADDFENFMKIAMQENENQTNMSIDEVEAVEDESFEKDEIQVVYFNEPSEVFSNKDTNFSNQKSNEDNSENSIFSESFEKAVSLAKKLNKKQKAMSEKNRLNGEKEKKDKKKKKRESIKPDDSWTDLDNSRDVSLSVQAVDEKMSNESQVINDTQAPVEKILKPCHKKSSPKVKQLPQNLEPFDFFKGMSLIKVEPIETRPETKEKKKVTFKNEPTLKSDVKEKLKVKMKPLSKSKSNKLKKHLKSKISNIKGDSTKNKSSKDIEKLIKNVHIKAEKIDEYFEDINGVKIESENRVEDESLPSIESNPSKSIIIDTNFIKTDIDDLTEFLASDKQVDLEVNLNKHPKRRTRGSAKKKEQSVKEIKLPAHVNRYKIDENDSLSCRICMQRLNESKFYVGDPHFGHEEELAVLDPKLIYRENDNEKIQNADRMYHKITCYSIYCENEHLCSLDLGLIEKNVEIFFSGYLKNISDTDTSIEKAVPGKHFGPIKSWWIKGFNNDGRPIVGLSTDIGDYLLSLPSDGYAPLMQSFSRKVFVTKVVIEYLMERPNAIFEDLMAKLKQTTNHKEPLFSITEDYLMHCAQFICDQIMLFDEVAESHETLLITSPCMRRIIDLTGIELNQKAYGKSKMRSYRQQLVRKLNESKTFNSITSDLIDKLFPFSDATPYELYCNDARRRCGLCKFCLRPNCNKCKACKLGNCDRCLERRCIYREIQEANDEDLKETSGYSHPSVKNSLIVHEATIKAFISFQSTISWPADPITTESNNAYYNSMQINDETISQSDYVFVNSVDPMVAKQIMRIAYMWVNEDGVAYFHANHLWRCKDTVIGEYADIREFVWVQLCSDMPLSCVERATCVIEQRVGRNWEGADDLNDAFQNNRFYRHSYDPLTGRFENLPNDEATLRQQSQAPAHRFCVNCERSNLKNSSDTPTPSQKLREVEDRIVYGAARYKDEEYKPGHFVYLKPRTLYFKYPMIKYETPGKSTTCNVDEEKYPEDYRRSWDKEVGKNEVARPYDIGYITEIFSLDGKLYVRLKKLFRPDNTQRAKSLNWQADANMLYWSNEECSISFNNVVRKCYVTHLKNIRNSSVDEWTSLGPDCFYFTQTYDKSEFFEIHRQDYHCENYDEDDRKVYPVAAKKLKALDLFAGCGGLSLGLRQAGLIESCWAIEDDEAAASTYTLNSSDTIVFNEACDVILKKICRGEKVLKNQRLPQQGDVEFLCATLVNENYKSIIDVETFKTSKIATFVSYCDYFKPSFFVLEADERLVKRSNVLKLALASLIGVGYQVSFDLLQVGSFGVPLNRRRSVIIGAAPGLALPQFPKGTHVFPKSLCDSKIVIDNIEYTLGSYSSDSAPYRLITAREAFSDLPEIKAGHTKEVINYDKKAQTQYQRSMRIEMLEPTLFDHCCLDQGPLVQMRMALIKQMSGYDWRYLPNIEAQLVDGSFTKKLNYNYDDKWCGRSKNNLLRGVCSCCTGDECNPQDRQENTLIPWHLVHSASKHQNWKGLYGRLDWESYLEDVVSNPEPLGTQGPVLHPTQSRVISVRELARAQGFPDDFKVSDGSTVYEKYQQIADSSSPLMARAIGYELVGLAEKRAENVAMNFRV